MFQCESLAAARWTLPALPTDPGMLLPIGTIGGTQTGAGGYPQPDTTLLVPVDGIALEDAGPVTGFRTRIPLGAPEGYYRVRIYTEWTISVPSGGPSELRIKARARIVDTAGVVLSEFDAPGGVFSTAQLGNVAAGPFLVYFAPIDPIAPVLLRGGAYLEVTFVANVTIPSPNPGDTVTVLIANGGPPNVGPTSIVELDTGAVGL